MISHKLQPKSFRNTVIFLNDTNHFGFFFSRSLSPFGSICGAWHLGARDRATKSTSKACEFIDECDRLN